MKYTKKDLGSFNLHIINTTKLKTVTIRVVFHTPIIKEEVTKRTILSDILLQSSKKYQTRRDLTIKAEELYSADLATNNQRLGNYLFTCFNLQVLEDKYTEENNLEKSIEFLSEVILNPDIENNKFKSDNLEFVKHNAKVVINSQKEDRSSYSLLKALESFNKTSPVSINIAGYIDDIEKVDESNLYDTYYKMIDNDYVDIFVVGNVNNKDILAMIKKYFKFKKIKKKKDPYILTNKKIRKRRQSVKESIENSQSKLVMVCPINKLTPFERDYALPIANLIFGGGTDSKLFKEVREKNSLCYTIKSSSSKLDNIMIIRSGIDKINYTKTVELIIKNLESMKKGKFTEKDIEIAKEYYHTSLDEIEESDSRMINEVLQEEILNTSPIKERLEQIKKVKRQDIVKVCKKISIDTVFLLEGVKDEEN